MYSDSAFFLDVLAFVTGSSWVKKEADREWKESNDSKKIVTSKELIASEDERTGETIYNGIRFTAGGVGVVAASVAYKNKKYVDFEEENPPLPVWKPLSKEPVKITSPWRDQGDIFVPGSYKPGQTVKNIDVRSLEAGRGDLEQKKYTRQKMLLANETERYTPIQVTTEGVIYDGHHGTRCAGSGEVKEAKNQQN